MEDKSNFILALARNYDEGFIQIAVIKPDLENKGMSHHLNNQCKNSNDIKRVIIKIRVKFTGLMTFRVFSEFA